MITNVDFSFLAMMAAGLSEPSQAQVRQSATTKSLIKLSTAAFSLCVSALHPAPRSHLHLHMEVRGMPDNATRSPHIQLMSRYLSCKLIDHSCKLIDHSWVAALVVTTRPLQPTALLHYHPDPVPH